MYRDLVSNEVGREKGRRGFVCFVFVYFIVVVCFGIVYFFGLFWGFQNLRFFVLGLFVLDSFGGSYVWLVKVRGMEFDG